MRTFDHDCRTVPNAMRYEGEIGAPGFGQSWTCTVCGKKWIKLGLRWVEPERRLHLLEPEDVR